MHNRQVIKSKRKRIDGCTVEEDSALLCLFQFSVHIDDKVAVKPKRLLKSQFINSNWSLSAFLQSLYLLSIASDEKLPSYSAASGWLLSSEQLLDVSKELLPWQYVGLRRLPSLVGVQNHVPQSCKYTCLPSSSRVKSGHFFNKCAFTP